MRKSKIKGYDAFALLSELDDGMIAEAALPEVGRTVTDKSSRKDREPGLFARFLDSNWAAAIISMTVAVAVLMGIIAAGRMETKAPNRQEGVDNPAGTNQVALEAVPGESNALREDESDELPEFNVTPDNTPGRLPNQETGPVEVISDGFTVYPKGYCVWASGQQLDENGEMTGFEADGFGAVNQLGAIKDEIPKMSTSGNSFSLSLSDGMTLQNICVFEIVEIQNDTFEELALGVEGEDFSHDPIMYLATLPKNGDYIVVLEIHYENRTSADEYIMGVNEYAFWLTTGSGWDSKAPVRITHNDRAYLLERYTLQKSYYDAELGKEMVTDYDGAEKILKTLVKNMQTVTVVRGEPLSLYLAPFYDLKSVKAYCGLELWEEYDNEEPLELLAEWDADDYYFIFTAVFNGTGETEVAEFPIHIKLVEKTAEETYPNDVGETPEPPRVQVSTGWGNLYFGSKSLSSRYHEGYMLWVEMWDGEGLLSGDGFGATGQLSEIADSLPTIDHDVGSPVNIRLPYSQDTLTDVSVYDKQYKRVASGQDASVLTTLPRGSYIVVLTVVTQEDYIPEVEAYERTCTEYAFRLAAADNGSMKHPETNPRVVVSGGGQTAVFETEEDGFLAWTDSRPDIAVSWMPRVEGTPAASVIFADNEAMAALPDMKIAYGDTLTVALDAAGDDLWKVTLYDTEGGLVAEGNDLSVVNTLKNDGYGRRIIVILQVGGFVNENELACYEYPFILEVYNP